jgi:hypothetical protein
MAKEKELISLKDAAKLSGYSADYVGQLIRAGKVSGKQVFSNVVWMTTEEAIVSYLQREEKRALPETRLQRFVALCTAPERIAQLYTIALWFFIGIMGTFILLLLGVFAIGIDHTISEKYQQQVASKTS